MLPAMGEHMSVQKGILGEENYYRAFLSAKANIALKHLLHLQIMLTLGPVVNSTKSLFRTQSHLSIPKLSQMIEWN